jgi:hypothetical protein
MSGHAFRYHGDRERQVFAECERIAYEFFSEAAAYHRTPFWAARTAAPPPPADDAPGRLQAAYTRLRQPAVRLRPSPHVRFDTAPEIEGREIVLREAIVVPGAKTPVRFAAGVNLPILVRLAAQFGDIAAILSAYDAQVGPAPADSLVTGLSVLVAREALILEDFRP